MASSPQVLLVARRQTRLALFAFFLMAVLLGSLAALTRSASIENWIEIRRLAAYRETRLPYPREDYFQAPNELWMYNELPHADFSRGGVCFFGASDVVLATKQWELPPELKPLVHDYGVGACNHQGDLDIVRYLVEDKGLLRAGGSNTLAVIGVCYETSCAPGTNLHKTFTNALELHDLYAFDRNGKLHEVTMSPAAKFFDFEQTHQGVFLNRVAELIKNILIRRLHQGHLPVRVLNPPFFIQKHKQEMGPNWQKKIDDSSPVFRELLDYLKAHGVPVRVIFTFQGSWNEALPANAEYKRQITAICAQEHVPITDWSHLLTDDEFGDDTHPNLDGMAKTHAAFLQIAIPFLRSTHALPDDYQLPAAASSAASVR